MNKIFRNFMMVASLFTAGLLTSCEQDDPEVELTEVSPMSGEWYVQVETQNAAGQWEDALGHYAKIMTSSTAANNSSQMWIGDVFTDPRNIDSADPDLSGTIWSFMVRANVDLGAMTFNANDKSIIVEGPKTATPTKPAVPAEPYDINVKITEGQVIKGGSTPPSKTTTDSIHFKAEFEDDPGTIYRISGYKRTGFLEDEH